MPPGDINDKPSNTASDTADQGGITSQATPAEGLPVVAPDAGEEVHGDEMDNAVPTHGYRRLPVVGLGGSAGGIQALKSFFAALPPHTGMAYVVILHLSPEHESTLPSLLQSSTLLPVKAAEDGERLQANHVYVIPPRKHLTLTDGHLRLTPLEPERGKRVAVDLFFRSLADTHGPHAAAVVLSGADSDGVIGIKRIKERGGLTIAQEPGEAEHESMPRSAIATEMVDWVLPVAEMPSRILRYRSSESRLRLPPEEGPQPAKPAPPSPDQDETALREVLVFLHTRTGSNFTYYKRATILRRIARRMQINEVTTLPDYLSFLRTHPGEASALMQDLLISVTNFFRDREAFAAVEARIPTLFAGKGPGDTVRVWTAACATGEEAYSLAMLLHEHVRRMEHPPRVQIFGCDLDEQAIQTARAGLYPATIAADVSEERLTRFFVKEVRGYRVRRELRETVLFAQHDLLKDAPFSRMDLMSCRNLLIYLDREAQSRALEIFHFALRPEGLLFLGSAESVDEEKALFTPLDKKHCLFVRSTIPRVGLPVPTGTGTLQRALQAQAKEAPVVLPATFVHPPALPFASPPRPLAPQEQASLAELHFKLTERYAPPSLIVSAEGNIVHLSENVGRFLRPPGGQVTTNFLQMVLPSLRMELRAALLRMEGTRAPAETFGVAVELEEGVSKLVDLRVAPAAELAPGYVLVSFAARTPDAATATVPGAAPLPMDAEAVVRHLERELEAARARLHDTVERSHATEEEYQSSNEELQSINEELRSASEELETSREELQSLNEELTTVNQELKHHVEEVGRANGDLHNLMNATAIATVFLDRESRVTRYTPGAMPLFNLIPSDTGRPLGDLKHHVDYPELEADVRQVLRTLVPVEREVGGPEESWFLARLLPYRSLEDRIEGVVLTLVDITARRQAEAALRELDVRYRAMADTAPVLIWEADESGVIFVNDHHLKFFGVGFEEVRGSGWARFLHPDDAEVCTAGYTKAVRERRSYADECRYLRADGEYRWLRSTGQPAGTSRFVGCSVDITEEKRTAANLAFLAEVSQDLVRLTNIDETMDALGAKISAHFHASQCAFCEADGDGQPMTVTHEWKSAGSPGLQGTYRGADYHTGEFQRACEAGEAFAVRDVATDPRMDAAQMKALGIHAFVCVPLVRDGAWRFNLNIYDSAPRDWREDEIELLRELTTRVWTRLEHARAEEAVRASEAKIMAVFEALPVGVGFLDKSGTLILSNHDMQHYLPTAKLPSRDDSQHPRWRTWHPDGSPVERNDFPGARALRGEKVVPGVEMLHMQDDGTEVWTRVAAVPFTDDKGQIIGQVAVVADIDALKRAEEALRLSLRETESARAEAERANQAKNHFLAVLSHELRTPLMPITMALAVLARRKDLPDAVRKAHAMIKRNVELEARFIDDMLDVTRITQGKMEIVCQDMDLHEAMERAVEVSSSDIKAKGQQLTISLEAVGCRLSGDFARLQQVFWNLLKNASKFTPPGGAIHVRSRHEGADQMAVEVTDTGIGMDPEALVRVFRPFEQADTNITRDFGGLGLGLAIAKGTVEAHGGTLHATSPGLGQGATFTVTLPRTVSLESAEAAG